VSETVKKAAVSSALSRLYNPLFLPSSLVIAEVASPSSVMTWSKQSSKKIENSSIISTLYETTLMYLVI